MNTLKKHLLIAVALLGLVGFSSCDSKEKMERHILEGYCWEGFYLSIILVTIITADSFSMKMEVV